MRKVSVIIPVYNEERYIEETIRRVLAADLGSPELEKEVIVVDDGSTDDTARKIAPFKNRITSVDITRNRGKGHAIKKGLEHAHGDIIVIQDADMEYNPADYPELLKPIVEDRSDVVYGSRFVGSRPHRVLLFWHYAANRGLTLLSNMAANLNLTDMETGAKAFRAEALRSIKLREPRFGFEPEVTIKLARAGRRFYEVGVSYNGRTYREGKKISWRDGVRALWVIVRAGLFNI